MVAGVPERDRVDDQPEISDDLDHTRSLYHEEVRARAVLSTKLDLLSQFDWFRQWGTRVGALLSGAGLASAVQAESLHFTEILLFCSRAWDDGHQLLGRAGEVEDGPS